MKIQEIMTRSVKTVRPDQTLQEAAKLMDDLNVGGLPVAEGSKIIGFITDRDIVIRSVSEGLDPKQTRVTDSMTQPVHFCKETDDVTRAADFMLANRIRRVLVKDESDRLTGIVSLGDLMIRQADSQLARKVTEGVSRTLPPKAA